MLPTPTLETARLTLRVVAPADADEIAQIANDKECIDNTLTLPFPYERSDALAFVERVRVGVETGKEVCFGVRLSSGGELVGTMGLSIAPEHERAELGYLFGRAHWGRGYATEAAEAVVAYGFGELGLHKLFAAWYLDNPASGRVLEKCGFVREGVQREHIIRGGRRRDSVTMGLLRRDYETQQRSAEAGEREG